MQQVTLRKFPYPFKTALSICSDIDETDTVEKFLKIQSFMNEEIGIKFTNTFFPFHDDGDFSLFSGGPEDKKTIIEHITDGRIDAIHSYGEKSDFVRDDARKTLTELRENNCELDTWIDHAESSSNICKYRFYGTGDIPQAKEYHFDLTRHYGIKFIWTERLTNIIGQGVPSNVTSVLQIFDSKHPLYSLVQLLKTSLKVVYDCFGSGKYNYFKDNKLVNVATLNDGQKIYEFVRFNNYYAGAAAGDSFEELHYTISQKVLSRVKKAGGYSIVYVHLGKKFKLSTGNGKKTVSALRNLKKEFDSGNIWVESTSNVLNYYINTRYLDWTAEVKGDSCSINIKSINDPIFGGYKPDREQLRNITFYTPFETRIFLGDQEIKNLQFNPPDQTGRQSVTIVTGH